MLATAVQTAAVVELHMQLAAPSTFHYVPAWALGQHGTALRDIHRWTAENAAAMGQRKYSAQQCKKLTIVLSALFFGDRATNTKFVPLKTAKTGIL